MKSQANAMVAKDIKDFLKYKQTMVQGVNFKNGVDSSQFSFFLNKSTANKKGVSNKSTIASTTMPKIMYPTAVKSDMKVNSVSSKKSNVRASAHNPNQNR